MEYRLKPLSTLLNATTTNTVVRANTKNLDCITLAVGTAAATDGTLKIRHSVDPGADITAAKSATNLWDYIHSYNLNAPGSGVDGSTGYTLGASANVNIRVNFDFMSQIAVEITGQSAGAYTVKLAGLTTNGQ